MSEIMACTQGLFSDRLPYGSESAYQKTGLAEGWELLFTIHTVEETAKIATSHPYMKTCRLWHRAYIYYGSLEQSAYLDLNIWYDASTQSQLAFPQSLALQASLNKARKICNHLSCDLSMTYRTSFHAAFGSQFDMNTDKKEENELFEKR